MIVINVWWGILFRVMHKFILNTMIYNTCLGLGQTVAALFTTLIGMVRDNKYTYLSYLYETHEMAFVGTIFFHMYLLMCQSRIFVAMIMWFSIIKT